MLLVENLTDRSMLHALPLQSHNINYTAAKRADTSANLL